MSNMAQVLRPLNIDRHPDLLVGTGTCDDAGVFRLTDDLALVQTVDFFPPLVDDPEMYGRIAAANSLSDVWAMGGRTLTALNIVGFPDHKLELDVLTAILRGGADMIRESDTALVGGHTVRDDEIKYGLSVTGTIHPGKIIANAGARPGEKLVLTKPLGTGVMAAAVKAEMCPPELYDAACAAMTRLNKDARDAMVQVGVTGATDVTGFGLVGHAWEMASGSGVEIVFRVSAIPYLAGSRTLLMSGLSSRAATETGQALKDNVRFDDAVEEKDRIMVLDAQTSGGLLISCPADRVDDLMADLEKRGVPDAAVVGEVHEAGEPGPRVRIDP
jgi:selenide,water dikinase